MLPLPHFAICTSSFFASTASGCKLCPARQLSSIPTCCTQLTVHLGAHPLCVKNSRCRLSAVYSSSGTPGYPRCCEHQCTSPCSQIYRYREPARHFQSCSLPLATLCWKEVNRENDRFPRVLISSQIFCFRSGTAL